MPAPARSSWHAVHIAAQDGDLVGLTACLIDPQAVNMRNKRENTPLMLASGAGHLALVKALLDAGATASLTNNRRLSAQDLLARSGKLRPDDPAILALLLHAQQQQQQQQQQLQQREPDSGRAQQPQASCAVCGEKIPRRQKIDYLSDDSRSRSLTSSAALSSG